MGELTGRTVGIWGLGKEGLSVARAAAEQGAALIEAVNDGPRPNPDLPDIPNLVVHNGLSSLDRLRTADIVFVSPGVPWHHRVFVELRESGIPVSSAADWYMAAHGVRTVGITGTKGKSTTASFLAHLLNHLGVSALVAGNIGIPLSDVTPAQDIWVVAELSSQQCALLRTSPAVAVITNLYQDHLDWHGDIPSYYAAKANVFCHGSRALVTGPGVPDALRNIGIKTFPAELRELDPAMVRTPAAGTGNIAGADAENVSVMSYAHNALNAALAALAAAEVIGRPVTGDELDAAAATFAGLPHRLQVVRRTGGRRWIDDTLATTGESVVVALQAMAPTERLALIVGGMDRQLDYGQLDSYLCSGARDVTLIQGPTNGSRIGVDFTREHPDRSHRVGSLGAAVELAGALPGIDVVLLSPGAASYDIYRNYESKAAAYCGFIDTL